MEETRKIHRWDRLKEYRIYIFFFLLVFLILLPGRLWEGTDDTILRTQIEEMGSWQWIRMVTESWSPRIASTVLFAVFHFNLPVWRVVVAGAFTLTLFLICNYGELEKRFALSEQYRQIIAGSAFFLMFPNVFSASVVWYTGSFVYMLPTMFLLAALFPFYDAMTGNFSVRMWMVYFAFVSSVMAAYQEQCAAIAACFAIISFGTLFLQKRKIPGYLIVQFVLLAANIGVYLFFSRTSIREFVEIVWYKDFPMLSLTEKLFQGVNWGNYQLFNASNLLMLLLTGLLILVISCRYQSRIVRFFAAIPFAFTGLSVIPFGSLFSRISVCREDNIGILLERAVVGLMDPTASNPSNFSTGFSGLFPSFLCLLIVIFVGCLLLAAFADWRAGLANMSLYFAALLSSYVLGLSPTIFASRHRIFFITDVLLVLLIALLFRELQDYYDLKKGKLFYAFFIVLCGLGMCFALEQFLFNFNGGMRV